MGLGGGVVIPSPNQAKSSRTSGAQAEATDASGNAGGCQGVSWHVCMQLALPCHCCCVSLPNPLWLMHPTGWSLWHAVPPTPAWTTCWTGVCVCMCVCVCVCVCVCLCVCMFCFGGGAVLGRAALLMVVCTEGNGPHGACAWGACAWAGPKQGGHVHGLGPEFAFGKCDCTCGEQSSFGGL